jgi:hypothetical protein
MQNRFDQPVSLDGFVVCPIQSPAPNTDQLSWQCAIYQMAWERALADQRPIEPETARNLFACMN